MSQFVGQPQFPDLSFNTNNGNSEVFNRGPIITTPAKRNYTIVYVLGAVLLMVVLYFVFKKK